MWCSFTFAAYATEVSTAISASRAVFKVSRRYSLVTVNSGSQWRSAFPRLFLEHSVLET